MRLLVDTNVIIDFLAGSGDKSFYAAESLSYAESGDEDEFVSRQVFLHLWLFFLQRSLCPQVRNSTQSQL